MGLEFNDESTKPRFISKPNPLAQRSYQIFEYKEDKAEYEPVGDYTLINMDEDPDITEKKVMNLIALMNGRKNLIEFENLTNERVLFTINSEKADSEVKTIVFRTYNGEGVSVENAVLTIEKGVFDEFQSTN